MSKAEKKQFLKEAVILFDSREQKNRHILKGFDEIGIRYEERKLDYGDYSFRTESKGKSLDFSMSCIVERKNGAGEIYGNIMEKHIDEKGSGERIRKEFEAAAHLAKQCVLLIENCESKEALRASARTDDFMERNPQVKVKNIGKYAYPAVMSWQSANRYGFSTVFVSDPKNTAREIVETFYYYWRNYREYTRPRRK